jgi:putative membrane protein
MRGFMFPRFGMMGGFGLLVNVIVVALIILGVVILIRALLRKDNNKLSSNQSLNILKERFAKGEITLEEYETIKKNL